MGLELLAVVGLSTKTNPTAMDGSDPFLNSVYGTALSWDGPRAGAVDGPIEWSDTSGFIQRTGRNAVEPGQTLTETTYLVVFHSDEPPTFARWSMDYEFAASPPAAGAAGQTERQTASPTAEPAPPATGVQPNETCAGKEVGSSCWIELSNHPGCYTWYVNFQRNASATWSGDCAGGLARGSGSLKTDYTDREGNSASSMGTGELRNGKPHGHWTTRYKDGEAEVHLVEEGPFVDGQLHGRWTLRFTDGTVYEGPYANGKLHGRWTWRWASGRVSTSCFSHGEEIDC